MEITPTQANKLIDLLLGDFNDSDKLENRIARKLCEPYSDITLDGNTLWVKSGAAAHTVRIYNHGLSLGYYIGDKLKNTANRPTNCTAQELTLMVQEILEVERISVTLAYNNEWITVKATDQDGKECMFTSPEELREYVAHSLLNGVELSDIRPAAIEVGIMLQRAIKLNRQLDTTMDAALGNQSVGVQS